MAQSARGGSDRQSPPATRAIAAVELRPDAPRLPHVQRQQHQTRNGGETTPRRRHHQLLPAHAPGIAPQGPLDPDVQGDRWGGHKWSPWHPLNDLALSALELGNGLYRIRGRTERLIYIGEGNVRDRLLTHAGKLRQDSPQGTVLAAAAPLDYSAVLNRDWRPHQRLELETDLIAAHTIAFTAPPVAQFIG